MYNIFNREIIVKTVISLLFAFGFYAFAEEVPYAFIKKQKIKPLIDCADTTDQIDMQICRNPELSEKDYYFYKLYVLVYGSKGNEIKRESNAYYEYRKSMLLSQTVDYTEEGDCDTECFSFYTSQSGAYELGFLYSGAISDLISRIESQLDLEKVNEKMLLLWGIRKLPNDPVKRFFAKKQQQLELYNIASVDCTNANYSVLNQSGKYLIYQSFGSFCRGAGFSLNIHLACYRGSDYYDVEQANINIDTWRLDEYGNFENEIELLTSHYGCGDNAS